MFTAKLMSCCRPLAARPASAPGATGAAVAGPGGGGRAAPAHHGQQHGRPQRRRRCHQSQRRQSWEPACERELIAARHGPAERDWGRPKGRSNVTRSGAQQAAADVAAQGSAGQHYPAAGEEQVAGQRTCTPCADQRSKQHSARQPCRGHRCRQLRVWPAGTIGCSISDDICRGSIEAAHRSGRVSCWWPLCGPAGRPPSDLCSPAPQCWQSF